MSSPAWAVAVRPSDSSRPGSATRSPTAGPRIATLDSLVPCRRGSSRLTLSLAMHAAVALALVVLPLMGSPELPEPMTGTKAFFAAPADVAPPPPPPPAARAAKPPSARPVAQPAAFTAPIEVPDVVQAEESLDLGLEGGGPGGVEGGVPGGVMGGVVGGIPSAPPAPLRPVRVGGDVREPKKLKHVTPVYPDLAKWAHVSGVVIIEATISAAGRVEDARVLRSIPLLDQAALDAVRQWAFAPTLLDGVPVPIILTVTVTFSLTER